MLSVVNIKYAEVSLETKEMKEVMALIKQNTNEKSPEKYLPNAKHITCSFELKNAYTELANALRRCLIDEIPVKRISFSPENFTTDDEYILHDYLLSRIRLLPIDQSLDEKTTASLSITNNSSRLITVTTADIKCNKKTFPSDHYEVIHLRPGKSININNMFIESGINLESATGFTLLTNTQYEILDIEPFNEEKNTGMTSLLASPRHFRLGFKTKGNINVKKVMHMCCDELLSRLNKMKISVNEFIESKSDKIYYGNDLRMEKEESIFVFKFPNEYVTLPSLIARNCYILNPEILFVTDAYKHPAMNEGHIKIDHNNPGKIILDAIAKSQKDLQKIKSAF